MISFTIVAFLKAMHKYQELCESSLIHFFITVPVVLNRT